MNFNNDDKSINTLNTQNTQNNKNYEKDSIPMRIQFIKQLYK